MLVWASGNPETQAAPLSSRTDEGRCGRAGHVGDGVSGTAERLAALRVDARGERQTPARFAVGVVVEQFDGAMVADLCDAFAQLAGKAPEVAASCARKMARTIRQRLGISAPAWSRAK